MSVSYSRLPVPVFNLSWVSSTEENEPDRSHILLPGGGGSTKSGIKNQVMIYSINEKKKIEESVFDPPLMTDGLLKLGDKEDKENTSLCVQIIRGYIFDQEIYCSVFDQYVILLKPTYVEGKLTFKKICQFQADFGTEEGSSITSIIITKEGIIITGGDDHKVRVWGVYDLDNEKLNKKNEKNKEKKTNFNWKVNLIHQYNGFFGSISSIDQHPTRSWVIVSSRDGTCELYDWKLNSRILIFPTITDDIKRSHKIETEYAMIENNLKNGEENNKKIITDIKIKKEIRGCVLNWNEDNLYLYYIQCGKRGQTELAKWRITMEPSPSNKNNFKFTSTFLGKLKVSDVPCTRLAIRRYSEVYFLDSYQPTENISKEDISIKNNMDLLAIGTGDGKIIVVRGLDFTILHTHPTHQLPVTGLSFSPSYTQPYLASTSADNSLALTKIDDSKSSGSIFNFLLALFLIIIAIVLFYKTILLNEIANEL